MDQIDQNTVIPVGIVATIGIAIWRFAKWLLGINEKIDLHTVQLNKLEERVENADLMRQDLLFETQKLSERMARIETKIDMMIDSNKK